MLQLIDLLQENFPHLRILARADSRQHAYQILRKGVDDVYRETLGSALDLGGDALRALGVPEAQASRAVELLREHDEASVREMAKWEGDEEGYTSMARLHIANLEKALASDAEMARKEAGNRSRCARRHREDAPGSSSARCS